jgi:hypothetical protein
LCFFLARTGQRLQRGFDLQHFFFSFFATGAQHLRDA